MEEEVMDCVTTMTFSLLVMVVLWRNFILAAEYDKGILYLYICLFLCAKVYSRLIRKVEEGNSLHGIRIAPTTPHTIHFLFDGDCTSLKILCRMWMLFKKLFISTSCRLVKKINFDKTTVSFSKGVSNFRIVELANKSGVWQAKVVAPYQK